ncbi:MAG: 3-phosphoshikimate 1-carboxyvinyltransferase [Anaerolineaceae bacterium]|nr:3-phosphoshikimate 1-carboxyvinyltransferase [Anaerolineaceae bacterium]MCB9099530.1 3-phosphoshikimate 1-carboxyvinyltransferase [Anaerolineales bacterium]
MHPSDSLTGEVTVPGDKSISHRALIFAAVADGLSTARHWLDAGVTARMVDCIRALGIEVEVEPTGSGRATLRVHGQGLYGLSAPAQPLFCGGSATTMRLMMGLLATQPFTSTLDGHEGLRRRPMERIAQPLRQMGAKIDTTAGHAPLAITGGRLHAIDYDMPVASAQLQTALILAALGAEGRMTLHQPGPARDHTLRLLRHQGIDIQGEDQGIIAFSMEKTALKPLNFTVPGDMSSAAFLMTAALTVPHSEVVIRGVNTNYTRTGLLDVLQAMGGPLTRQNEQSQAGEPVADVSVKAGRLEGVEVKGEIVVRMIDEFPIFTVAALHAHGKTLVRDAAELRLKESDRIAVVIEELGKMGAKITPHPDGFEIEGPQPLTGAVVRSQRDHRLAMSLAVAGLSATGTTIIEDAQELNESFPGFIETLQSLGAKIETHD